MSELKINPISWNVENGAVRFKVSFEISSEYLSDVVEVLMNVPKKEDVEEGKEEYRCKSCKQFSHTVQGNSEKLCHKCRLERQRDEY